MGEKQEFEEFKIETREEIESFNNMLNQFSKLPYLDLLKIYDFFQFNPNKKRLLAIFVDLRINLVLCQNDINDAGGIWNKYFSKDKLEGGSVLDSFPKFNGKMGIHRFFTSFIFRYRAIWDKLMGLIILMYLPEDYERFTGSKSKKKAFIKYAKKTDMIEDSFIDQIIETLTNFDNEFRTPEAHKTGRLRKYSFLMNSLDKNPSIELIGYWNMLIRTLVQIDRIFEIEKDISE